MADLGSDAALIVTPEKLKETAGEIAPIISSMAQHFSTLSDIMKRTAGYWLGDAGNHYREAYLEKEELIEEMIKRLEEHPRDLMIMGGVYKEGEEYNKKLAGELPGDALS